ncbi:MAG: hypothetical protein JOY78_18870, partial [Pseudonocardia sp.]|nr:hypothetical protein [Pseudonocardia sp.]
MGGTSTDRSLDSNARSPRSARRSLRRHLRTKGSAFLAMLTVCAGPIGLLRATPAFATAKSWTGSSGTSWTTSNSWSPSGAPLSGDDVTIGNVTNDPSFSTGSVTIASLTINNGG